MFEYKTDIILRNRHCHRFITFTVVYFTFCFRKKIFFQSSTIQYRFFLETFFTFFWFFSKSTSNILPAEILSLNSSILPIAMKVGSKDADTVSASFALLFVKNYAILDLSDKISAGGWWIPKCCFFTALKSDNAQLYQVSSINDQYSNSKIQFHINSCTGTTWICRSKRKTEPISIIFSTRLRS